MCGIAGFIQSHGEEQVLEEMLSVLVHRGPDGQGQSWKDFKNWQIALGHRRLAIIDIEGGRQPIGNRDGSIQLTFNGEIFNYRELRKDLIEKGYSFKTESDSEVIVYVYEEYGEKGFSKLNGMFAFAIWDHHQGKMILCRDRVGIKPLYYGLLPQGGLVFASELSALLKHPLMSKKLSLTGVSNYFFSDYMHPPVTMVEGAQKLSTGHYIIWEDGRLNSSEPYWQLQEGQSIHQSEEGLKNELDHRLHQAVKRQLVSDVPVGVFLSGGIDSSLVAAVANEHYGQSIETFSIGFENKDFDESSHARILAKHIGTKHNEEVLSEEKMLSLLDSVLDSIDEPFADPSILPTYFLSQVTAQSLKVVLGGDGGDELWAGYPTYRAHKWAKAYQWIPSLVKDYAICFPISQLKTSDEYQSLEWKLKRFSERWDDDLYRRHFRWMSNLDLPDLEKLNTQFEGYESPFFSASCFPVFRDKLNGILAMDFTSYLPGSVLAKVDRASMAHSLEVRPPFLDNDLIDFAYSVPSQWKYRGRESKYLLKKVASKYLPQEIWSRPKKGFGVPLARWFRGALKGRLESVLENSLLWDEKILNQDQVKLWYKEFKEREKDFSKTFWALIVLDHWIRKEGISGG